MSYLKTKKQTTLMSNTSANACRETNCTCYSFVTTKTPVITHRGLTFDKTSSQTGRRRIIRVALGHRAMQIRTNRKTNSNTLNPYRLQQRQERAISYERVLIQNSLL